MYHFEDSIQIKNTLGMQITVHTVLLLKTKKKVSKEFTVSWKYDTPVITTKAGVESKCYATEIRSQEGNEMNLQAVGSNRRGSWSGS